MQPRTQYQLWQTLNHHCKGKYLGWEDINDNDPTRIRLSLKEEKFFVIADNWVLYRHGDRYEESDRFNSYNKLNLFLRHENADFIVTEVSLSDRCEIKLMMQEEMMEMVIQPPWRYESREEHLSSASCTEG